MKPLVKVLVSVVLFLALLLIIPWSELRETFVRASLGIWLVALGGWALGHSAGIVKWRMLVNVGGAKLGRLEAVMAYCAGLFANLCLPTVVGGDVLRATLAGRASRHPQAAIWGGLTDRVSDLVGVTILVAGGILVSRRELEGVWSGVATAGIAAMAVLAVAVAVPLLAGWRLDRWPQPIRRHVARALVTLRRAMRRPDRAVLALIISIAMQGGFTILTSFLGRSIGIHVPLAAWLLAWPLAKLAALVPISLGGLAVREAALASLLLPFGVPLSQGVIASLLWQSVNIVGGLIAGLVWLITARMTGRRVSLSPVAATESGLAHG